MKKCKCGKKMSYHAIQCSKCYYKTLSGMGNPNFKHGKHCFINYCEECGTEIDYRAKRCIFCFNKNNIHQKNGNYKKGLYADNKPKCQDCGKEIYVETYLFGTKRCKKCSYIYRVKIHRKNLKKHLCLNCKKEISKNAIRCHSCNMLNMLEDEKFAIKLIKNALQGQSRKQTQPEKLLFYLLPKQFKYVGNGRLFINRFNPDFIDIKRKLIIEVFGDYWHNLPNYKKRDIIKLKLYKKLGYKFLIIWAKELKNQDKLQQKLIKFL